MKNVASHTLEVKKLVYLYLLHYAEKYGIFRILVYFLLLSSRVMVCVVVNRGS